MSNKINFLFRCNTLTSFERTSSSCVHCSNEQIETGSSGAPTIQNGYFGLRVQVPAVPEFWALVYQGTQNPRLCCQEDLPAQILQRSIKATTRFQARSGERGRGCCYPLPPLERANSNNNVLGVDGSQQGFQFMKIQTEDGK